MKGLRYLRDNHRVIHRGKCRLFSTSDLALLKSFLCVLYVIYLRPVSLFCDFGVFSSVCFELSVPVQVICLERLVSEMTCYLLSGT